MRANDNHIQKQKETSVVRLVRPKSYFSWIAWGQSKCRLTFGLPISQLQLSKSQVALLALPHPEVVPWCSALGTCMRHITRTFSGNSLSPASRHSSLLFLNMVVISPGTNQAHTKTPLTNLGSRYRLKIILRRVKVLCNVCTDLCRV